MVAHLLISQHSLYRLFFFYVQNVSQCNHQRHALHLEQKGVHFVLCFFGAGCLKVRVLLCCSTKVLSVDVCHSNKAPHPPSLYFSSTKTLWANVQIQHRKCLFDTRLSFLSVIMSKKKKKEVKCQIWKRIHCSMHGLKIWWMYFFKCQRVSFFFFFNQIVLDKTILCLLPKHLNVDVLFSFVSFCWMKGQIQCLWFRLKETVHARKKTAQSNADMDTCAVQ